MHSCNVDICFKASSWHLKCSVFFIPLVGFPQEAFTVKTKTLMCFFFFSLSLSLSLVFKKAVILVYRENNKLKKKMVRVVCATLTRARNCVWYGATFFLPSSYVAFFFFLLFLMTRPTLVLLFVTEILTRLSSVGSFLALRCRSDWEMLQVRRWHTAVFSPFKSLTKNINWILAFLSHLPAHAPQISLLSYTLPSSDISVELPRLLSLSETADQI